MLLKVQYKTNEEKEKIIAEQEKMGKILVEVQNHFDGNFLVFSEPQVEPETIEQLVERKIREMVSADALKQKGDKRYEKANCSFNRTDSEGMGQP